MLPFEYKYKFNYNKIYVDFTFMGEQANTVSMYDTVHYLYYKPIFRRVIIIKTDKRK